LKNPPAYKRKPDDKYLPMQILSSDMPLLFCVFRNYYAEKPLFLSKYLLYNIDIEVILFNAFFLLAGEIR